MQPWLDRNLGMVKLNPDPPHGIDGQCVNAASSWSLAQGGPELLGPPDPVLKVATAWTIWLNFRNAFYTEIYPGGHLSPGDIVFFQPNNSGAGTGWAGHVDIAVDSITPQGFRGADTDWNGSPKLQYVNHSFNGVAGWLHPVGGLMATDALTKEEIEIVYQLAYLESPAGSTPEDLIDAYTGKPLAGLLQQLQVDPTRLGMVERGVSGSMPGVVVNGVTYKPE